MAGRIECYMHSDNTTKNKIGAMVKVSCQTDFAAKNTTFVSFCKNVAKWACGLQTTDPDQLLAYAESGLAEEQSQLQLSLKEKISIKEIVLMKV